MGERLYEKLMQDALAKKKLKKEKWVTATFKLIGAAAAAFLTYLFLTFSMDYEGKDAEGVQCILGVLAIISMSSINGIIIERGEGMFDAIKISLGIAAISMTVGEVVGIIYYFNHKIELTFKHALIYSIFISIPAGLLIDLTIYGVRRLIPARK